MRTASPSVLKKTTEDELVDLVSYVQTLALDFLHTTVKGAKCVEANHAPLYVPDHMKDRRQFTGIVELLFKEVNEHRVAEGAKAAGRSLAEGDGSRCRESRQR